MSADPYSPAVRRLFANLSHVGVAEGGVSVQRSSAEADIELSARADDGRVHRIRFRAYGCPHVLAACETLCETVEGQPLAALADFDCRALQQTLPVPVEKTGRLLLLEDALKALNCALDGRNV
jgi:NifU-like protein involved in Fe-S cluster formation